MKLDHPRTFREIADMCPGWSEQRIRRHLLRLNQELHGTLLKNTGRGKQPRWTVTLNDLQRACPGLFPRGSNLLRSEIDDLERRMRELASRQHILLAGHRKLGRLLEELSEQVRQLAQPIENYQGPARRVQK